MTPIDKAIEELEFIARGCLVPPDGGSPNWPDDAIEAAQRALEALRAMQEGKQGQTTSSQTGGCDYMSLENAKKHCQRYIDQEMRDPNGLDDTAKAMLTLFRNMQERQSLDVEALKINDGKRRGDAGAVSNRIYEDGWNSCVDHLAARGLIGSVKSTTQLVDELRSRGLDVEIRADGINVTPPPKNGGE